MGNLSPMNPTTTNSDPGRGWWRLLSGYQWFVLIVAALGWLLDCLDQQLFLLARVPAMKELLQTPGGGPPRPDQVAEFGAYTTSIFLLGWASGGLVFGVVGDRWGRARTMLLTILLYSGFTGLSALSTHFWDFALYRFLTGLGVGGEFAVGVTLVAEVMPDAARPYALSLLQALSTVGNIGAALISMGFGQLERAGLVGGAEKWAAWRWMFVLGALPALLLVWVRRRLREPDRWLETRRQAKVPGQLGDYGALFGNPHWKIPAALAGGVLLVGVLIGFLGPAEWNKRLIVTGFAGAALVAGLATVYGGGADTRYRRRAVVGVLLAMSGVIGLWGIGFFSFDLVRSVLEKKFRADGMDPKLIGATVTQWVGVTSIMQNLGAALGIYSFGLLAQKVGRRPAFAVTFIAAAIATASVFSFFTSLSQIFWLIPLMGFFQLGLFGGYAMYLPELFPTRLRSTGTSFCYNVGRFVAASGPAALGQLTAVVFKDRPEPMRAAGVFMSLFFVLGLVTLWFAPETKGAPLPEEGMTPGAKPSPTR